MIIKKPSSTSLTVSEQMADCDSFCSFVEFTYTTSMSLNSEWFYLEKQFDFKIDDQMANEFKMLLGTELEKIRQNLFQKVSNVG